MNTNQKPYSLSSALRFGKYKGRALRWVIDHEPGYIAWCVAKCSSFYMDDAAWSYAASVSKELAAMSPMRTPKAEAVVVEWCDASGLECLSHYPWKDAEAARRSYMASMRARATDATIVPLSAPRQLELWA